MRRMPILTLLPLMLLGACQSTAPQQTIANRPCTERMESAGTCNPSSSISSFPELANVN